MLASAIGTGSPSQYTEPPGPICQPPPTASPGRSARNVAGADSCSHSWLSYCHHAVSTVSDPVAGGAPWSWSERDSVAAVPSAALAPATWLPTTGPYFASSVSVLVSCGASSATVAATDPVERTSSLPRCGFAVPSSARV